MKYTYLFILWLFSVTAYSQNPNLLKGKVVNSKKEAIPYANIVEFHRSFGTAANMHGEFYLSQPTEVLDTSFLRISALGYRDTVVSAAMLSKNPEVTLSETLITLSEFAVTDKIGERYKLGVLNRCRVLCGGFNSVDINSQDGILIENDKGMPLKINEVKVYVKKEGKPEAPFRLRVYEYDTITGLPGKDILLEQKIKSAGKGGKWVSFDLSKEHIYIPESGVVVAVEWILTDENYYYQRGEDINYGVVLGVGYFDKQMGYQKNYKTGWWKNKFFEDAKKFPAPAIRVYCSG